MIGCQFRMLSSITARSIVINDWITVYQNPPLQYVCNSLRMQKFKRQNVSNDKENWCNSHMKIQTAFNFATIFFYDNYLNKAPFTIRQRNLKTEVSPWKRIKRFPLTLRRRNLKTQKSSVILDLCLKRTRAGQSHDYRNTFSKSSVFKMFSVHT